MFGCSARGDDFRLPFEQVMVTTSSGVYPFRATRRSSCPGRALPACGPVSRIRQWGVARQGISEQALQQSGTSVRGQVVATVHHGYFLKMIVYRYRQMMLVGTSLRARTTSPNALVWLSPALVFLPGKRPCNRRCALHIKTAHVWIALVDPVFAFSSDSLLQIPG